MVESREEVHASDQAMPFSGTERHFISPKLLMTV